MTTSPKRKYIRLSPAQWAEVEALWQTGGVTLAELSERFGPSARALQNHFAATGTVHGSAAAAISCAVRDAVLKDELPVKDQLVTRAKDTRERAYRHADIVQDLVMAQLEVIRNDPSQALRVNTALKALSLAAGALDRLHELKRRALGLDDEGVQDEDLPELPIIDLTTDEIAGLRAQQEEDEMLDDWSVVDRSALSETETEIEEDVIVE